MEYLLSVSSIIGMVLTVLGAVGLSKLHAVQAWRPCKAEILKSEVRLLEVPEVHAINEYFIPFVQYRYVVAGAVYSSERISVDDKGWIFDEKAGAELFLNEIVDASTSYVNQNDHTESVLVRRVSEKRLSHYKVQIIAGSMIVAISIYLYFIA